MTGDIITNLEKSKDKPVREKRHPCLLMKNSSNHSGFLNSNPAGQTKHALQALKAKPANSKFYFQWNYPSRIKGGKYFLKVLVTWRPILHRISCLKTCSKRMHKESPWDRMDKRRSCETSRKNRAKNTNIFNSLFFLTFYTFLNCNNWSKIYPYDICTRNIEENHIDRKV